MKKPSSIRSCFLNGLAAAVMGVLASCGSSEQLITVDSAPVVSVSQIQASNGQNLGLEAHIKRQVNAVRAQHGLAAVREHAGLSGVARDHCREMALEAASKNVGLAISHKGFMERQFYAKNRYNLVAVGENLAGNWGAGEDTARKIVNDWMNSPAHRRNLLSKWQVAGVGVYKSPSGAVYVSQLFGSGGESIVY